ncbi:excalibur calcium-binding domain-containing protein [Arthrobacter sp. AQ5-05]|uniref:excalibur calcium-binding domain-containing protein n=1 Tax=Arthrobacter sp. AQ5-05 TaxID=2184581 RepID=UPI001E4646E4|nr:excalibur calcium-binding domain-containing protein [Arthrobacter sp. AQ5-05]
MSDTKAARPHKSTWQPAKSFWITAAIWLLILIICIATGGLGVWIVLFALFAILTALYTLVSGRRSWLGLPNRKAGGTAVGAGVAALVLGSVVMSATMPATEPVAEVAATTTATTTATATKTPSPSAKSALYTKCTTAAESKKESGTALTCTLGDDGTLVWLTESRSKEMVAERAVVTAKEEAAKAAAKKVEDDKAAAVAAEATKVAAVNAAAQQAASDDAARVAAQQAAQKAPAPPVQAPPAAVYYANCAAVRAAGVAPIYRGQPGYSSTLDRDGDGIACEK